MHYFLCDKLFVRMGDVKNVWKSGRKKDKISFKMKSGKIHSFEDLMGKLFYEYKEMEKIRVLNAYMVENGLASAYLAKQINVSQPAISNLFIHKKLSKKMETKIRKRHSTVFKNFDDRFKNPLLKK